MKVNIWKAKSIEWLIRRFDVMKKESIEKEKYFSCLIFYLGSKIKVHNKYWINCRQSHSSLFADDSKQKVERRFARLSSSLASRARNFDSNDSQDWILSRVSEILQKNQFFLIEKEQRTTKVETFWHSSNVSLEKEWRK